MQYQVSYTQNTMNEESELNQQDLHTFIGSAHIGACLCKPNMQLDCAFSLFRRNVVQTIQIPE
jgi:hypothetical protein